jgi:hypothetical protein
VSGQRANTKAKVGIEERTEVGSPATADKLRSEVGEHLLFRAVLLDVDQARYKFVVGVLEGFEQQQVKRGYHDQKEAGRDEMVRSYS